MLLLLERILLTIILLSVRCMPLEAEADMAEEVLLTTVKIGTLAGTEVAEDPGT
jgi:hypothetical protein